MWQAEHVRDRLRGLYPACDVSILGMSTRGDEILDRSLAKIGGKGLFVKELENALLDGRADLAVHSLKDVPMVLEPEFTLAALLEREDPHDAFVSNDYATLADLPQGAVVGTSSLRRACALRAVRPDLRIEPLRGNLDTRLGKLDRGDFSAIVLAYAGLFRLGMAHRVRSKLTIDESLPAAGQGALGIESLSSRADVAAALAPLHHPLSAACVRAERAVARALGGSCQVPLAAHAVVEDGQLVVRAMVASARTAEAMFADDRGALDAPEALGERIASALLARGAQRLLEDIA
jgi:hydroxymethylbilane synthase